jgi:hypothetical protein
MQQTFKANTTLSINLDRNTVRKLVYEYFKSLRGEDISWWVIDSKGDLIMNTEYHTTHSWVESRVVRQATDLEKAVDLIINNFQNLDSVGADLK